MAQSALTRQQRLRRDLQENSRRCLDLELERIGASHQRREELNVEIRACYQRAKQLHKKLKDVRGW